MNWVGREGEGPGCTYLISVPKPGSKFIEKSYSFKGQNTWTPGPNLPRQVFPLLKCKNGSCRAAREVKKIQDMKSLCNLTDDDCSITITIDRQHQGYFPMVMY